MRLLRPILFVHRWLGVVVGLLMTLWCLSGFVMMYADYPRLNGAEQVAGLPPLRLEKSADFGRVGLDPAMALRSARIEMMDGRAVLRIAPAIDPDRTISQIRATPGVFDLASGVRIERVGPEEARGIAGAFAEHSGTGGRVTTLQPIEVDQWTVQTFRGHQPLYKARLTDPAGSILYIAGTTGEVVQATTRQERFWAWLGAVPHWLYPTILRRNGKLWNDVVVWTSLLGLLLDGDRALGRDQPAPAAA